MSISAERRLEILFKKSLHHGFVQNVELCPAPTGKLKELLLPEERCVVLVRDKAGRALWFTDRRLLRQDSDQIVELFTYDSVRRVHWMARENRFQFPKEQYYDRLEIDSDAGDVQLDGLEQAYAPVLEFLWWLTGTRIVKE
jgi:tricorn protease-like protein